ncbi:MAG: hypothetical protein ACYTHM_00590 [Planctomycetota bacterium]
MKRTGFRIFLAFPVFWCLACAADHPFLSMEMNFIEAEKILNEGKAKEVQMDVRDETEDSVIRTYDLPDGSVLMLHVSKDTQVVKELRLCTNPEEPKAKRTWIPVKKVLVKKKAGS